MYGSCFLEASHRQTAGAAAAAVLVAAAAAAAAVVVDAATLIAHSIHSTETGQPTPAAEPPKRPAKLSKYVSGQTILLSQGGITLEEGRAYSNSWPPLLLSL